MSVIYKSVLEDHDFSEIKQQIESLSLGRYESLAKAIASIFKLFPHLQTTGKESWENITTIKLSSSLVYAPTYGLRAFDIVESHDDGKFIVFPVKISLFVPEWSLDTVLIKKYHEQRIQLSPQLHKILIP